MTGTGTKDDPWQLNRPPGTPSYQMYRDDAAEPVRLVCVVGSTTLYYDARCLDDLPAMLRQATVTATGTTTGDGVIRLTDSRYDRRVLNWSTAIGGALIYGRRWLPA